MREPLYNQRFEDIYFSPEDGLAETQHVFLRGNTLPERWAGRERFTIVETGFGTGLNFLAAWQMFEETAAADAELDFVSFELYPLARDEISGALEGWAQALGGRLGEMLRHYPLRVPGFHRIQFGPRVRFTLVFDDVNTALPELVVPGGVDAWFLDGFAPSKNPQMWSDTLYREMTRLSAAGASVATFTVAGHVRRGLAAAGFDVEKRPGFGRKKDMTVARFEGAGMTIQKRNKPQRIAIIGGGLAGTSCAHVLKRQGAEPVIFDKAPHLAGGASGNALGLYNPRFTALRGPESGLYTAAYAQAVRTMEALSQSHEIDYRRCGALHLVNSPEKEKRFRSLAEHSGWHEKHLAYLDAPRASATAGVSISQEALWLPDSGCVSPAALCAVYAGDAEVRLGTAVTDIGEGHVNGESFDAVILAGAFGTKDFDALSWLPLHTVRGQVSTVRAGEISARLRCNVCYGGYISAPRDGRHMLGSTFQKWLSDTEVRAEDHDENLARLAAQVPELAEGLCVEGGRAALRTASGDHFPVIGPACAQDGTVNKNLYVSAGHGSHGILSSLAGAHLLGDMILGNPYSLPQPVVSALAPSRFAERARRRKI